MYKVLLVDPSLDHFNAGQFFRHSVLEPLGLEYLASSLHQAGYEVDILQTDNGGDKILLQKISKAKPRVIGFSVYTYNASRIICLTKLIKRNFKSIKIIAGGPHVTAVPDFAEEGLFDCVLRGEGEEVLPILIGLKNFDDILGCKKSNGRKYPVIQAPRIKDLDKLPRPMRSPAILDRCRIWSVMDPPPEKQIKTAQILTSRGCPFSCTFCASANMFGRKVFYRSPANVVDEIECLQKTMDTNTLCFSDLNFALNKKYLRELCSGLKGLKPMISWMAECHIKNLDEESIALMAEAGCKKIAIGIERLDDYSLQKTKPSAAGLKDHLRKLLNLLDQAGIITRAFLLLGFPWENPKSLAKMAAAVQRLQIDDIAIRFVVPYPGTALYEECKQNDALIYEGFDNYTGDIPTIKTPGLSTEQLKDARARIYKLFYASNHYHARVTRKINRHPHLKDAFESHHRFLSQRGIT